MTTAPLVGLVARVFILGSLPHSEPCGNEFQRSFGDGRFRLSLRAPHGVGLPYGRIPRLILSHLTTRAVRERSPEIVLARTFGSFCSLLGVPPTGGPNGYLLQVKRQLHRLAHLSLEATWGDSGRRPRDPEEDLIYAAHSYPLASDECGPLTLRLSEEFFRLISHKPVPVDLNTLRRLQSPMAMDIYSFCTWRSLRALKRGRPEAIPWRELQKQIGSDYARLRDFRSRFKSHLATVLRFYPDIRVQATAESLIVHPYQPHIGRSRR